MKKLKRKMLRRLKSSAGESLAEVLASLLIAALALTMLASTIATSSKMITQSKNKMEDYYDQNDAMAEQSPSGELTASLSLSGSDVSLRGDDLSIGYSINAEVGSTKVISYWLEGDGE